MRNNTKILAQIIFTILVLQSSNAMACKFATMIEDFEYSETNKKIQPLKPKFTLTSINRGSIGQSSCSDIGSIELKLNNSSQAEQGYIFNVIEGDFNPNLFSKKPVTPRYLQKDKSRFKFYWYDNGKKPINILLQIIAVSKTGGKSKPQILRITNNIKKAPWWAIWNQQS